MVKTAIKLLFRAITHNKRAILGNAGAAVGLEILAVSGLYILNSVYGRLYEGIQNYDMLNIYYSIGLFSFIAMVLVVVNGYLGYFINRLAFAIRAGLTEATLAEPALSIPNYEQRVQEDFKRFSEAICDLSFAVLKSGLYLPVFLGVIIGITQWYIGVGVVIVVIAGTWLTRYMARPLIMAQAIQETNEAEFRKNLTPELFIPVKEYFKVTNQLFKRLSFTQAGLSQAFVLLPFILLMPFYLSKTIAMGQFFQAVNALAKIIDALSVLIDQRQVIVAVETTTLRLQPLIEE